MKNLSKEILENISEINNLLFQITNYWTKIEITKSESKKTFTLDVSVYTFITETKTKKDRLVYILNEEIKLNTDMANREIEHIIEKLKELIPATNEND